MPLVSDPGYRLVSHAVEEGVDVIALPGANAGLTALAASGMPTDSFCFLGFPPQKKGRRTFLDNLEKHQEMTIILFESPHRIVKLLGELNEKYSGRMQVCVAREITKAFEEFVRGTTEEVLANFDARQSIKGEFVVLLSFER
jgi:16S rRNA (cytidine1402-2'-O)-methyltransferase